MVSLLTFCDKKGLGCKVCMWEIVVQRVLVAVVAKVAN